MDILYSPFNNLNSLTANELFLELITKGVNIKIDQDDKTIRIIDFEETCEEVQKEDYSRRNKKWQQPENFDCLQYVAHRF